MSIFKNFFDRNKDEAPVDETSLNSVLREFDKERFKNEGNHAFNFESETAFDIIAHINNLKHHKLNIYKDSLGKRLMRTNLGFQPLTVYNKELENFKLKQELYDKDEQISNLKFTLEKTNNQLILETELLKTQKEKNTNLISSSNPQNITPKEAKRFIKKLSKLNEKLLNAFVCPPDQIENYTKDCNNETEIKKELIRNVKTNSQLKNVLLHSSLELSSLIELINERIKKH